MLIAINGVRTPVDEARLSVLDRGLLFGDAIYEVICTHQRRPFLLGEHLDRLEASGRAIGLDVAAMRGDLERDIAALIAAVSAEGGAAGELYIRIMITAGTSSALDLLEADGPPVRIVLVKRLAPWDPRLFEEGLRLKAVLPEEIVGRIAPWVKSNNRQANLMAHRIARRAGYDDGLFVDPEGRVTEGPSWNVFAVKDGAVRTPPLEGGLLPGITRSLVLRLCRELDLPAREEQVTLEAARTSDELFITSTTRGVMGVQQLDEVRLRCPGPITRRLAEAVQRVAEEEA